MLKPRRSYTAICPNPPWRPVADAFVSRSCVTPASCRKNIKFRHVQVWFQFFHYCVFLNFKLLASWFWSMDVQACHVCRRIGQFDMLWSFLIYVFSSSIFTFSFAFIFQLSVCYSNKVPRDKNLYWLGVFLEVCTPSLVNHTLISMWQVPAVRFRSHLS